MSTRTPSGCADRLSRSHGRRSGSFPDNKTLSLGNHKMTEASTVRLRLKRENPWVSVLASAVGAATLARYLCKNKLAYANHSDSTAQNFHCKTYQTLSCSRRLSPNASALRSWGCVAAESKIAESKELGQFSPVSCTSGIINTSVSLFPEDFSAWAIWRSDARSCAGAWNMHILSCKISDVPPLVSSARKLSRRQFTNDDCQKRDE